MRHISSADYQGLVDMEFITKGNATQGKHLAELLEAEKADGIECSETFAWIGPHGHGVGDSCKEREQPVGLSGEGLIKS